MTDFSLVSKFKPTGDQPRAISSLIKNTKAGVKNQVLLGVTGSGKTFTIANVIAKTKLPTLIVEPNKTLAAQVYQELKEFFPKDGVHYFVSYYDYYQPEAYLPQTDTYIEKDAKINDAIDQLRHAATADALSRRNIIIVASVSCIYGLGDPDAYKSVSLELRVGAKAARREVLRRLTDLQYKRGGDPGPGEFRTRDDTIELCPPCGTEKINIIVADNKIKEINRLPAACLTARDSKRSRRNCKQINIFPAKHFVTPHEKLMLAIKNIKTELCARLEELRRASKLLEAQRLEQRTRYDLELLQESGYCPGIENYSRHLSFRKSGQPPHTLIDYFPKNFLTVIDESHITISQLRAMAEGDRKRKEILVKFGFRLGSAIDNRPLTFSEFEQKIGQAIYVSATPGVYECKKSDGFVTEQLIRPTGILEPKIEVRPTKNQINNLIEEIKSRIKKNERVLILTLTKKLAEDVAERLAQGSIRVHWIHSEVKTLLRSGLLRDLREGKVDVVVGVNLLREGLDLPEVSLVAILDADKEGFLRNQTTLIQAMGRAARHPGASALLYADSITSSMRSAIKEISRRRVIQDQYNREHCITPKPIFKEIRAWPPGEERAAKTEFAAIKDVKLLQKAMSDAVNSLDFERAARLRDLIKEMKDDKKKP